MQRGGNIMTDKKLIPFHLEMAKLGEKVITRNGRSVRIICFDRESSVYPIIALFLDNDSTEEECECFTLDGKYLDDEETNDLDLFMDTNNNKTSAPMAPHPFAANTSGAWRKVLSSAEV